MPPLCAERGRATPTSLSHSSCTSRHSFVKVKELESVIRSRQQTLLMEDLQAHPDPEQLHVEELGRWPAAYSCLLVRGAEELKPCLLATLPPGHC